MVLTREALHTTGAVWPELTWHLGFAERVQVRLYEDAGDGEGPQRITTVRCAWDAAARALTLTREVDGAPRPTPRPERLLLHGPPFDEGASLKVDEAQVKVSWLDGGVLELKGRGDWERVRIE